MPTYAYVEHNKDSSANRGKYSPSHNPIWHWTGLHLLHDRGTYTAADFGIKERFICCSGCIVFQIKPPIFWKKWSFIFWQGWLCSPLLILHCAYVEISTSHCSVTFLRSTWLLLKGIVTRDFDGLLVTWRDRAYLKDEPKLLFKTCRGFWF